MYCNKITRIVLFDRNPTVQLIMSSLLNRQLPSSKLRQRLLQFTIACLLQFSTTVITIYDRYHNSRQDARDFLLFKITDASKRPIKNLIEAISWGVLKFSCFSKCANKKRSQGLVSMPSSIERNVKI